MTTETVCVPRDELLELLQDGVDDYWITTEDGARIVEILRASLAQSVIPDWRAYSAQFARGEKCPETLETLQAAWTRDQELIFDQKAQISRIKETVNDLRQKLAAQPVASEPVADGWVDGLPPSGAICESRIPHHTSSGRHMIWTEVEVLHHAIIGGAIYSWVKATGDNGGFFAPMMLSFRKIAAAPQPTDGSTNE